MHNMYPEKQQQQQKKTFFKQPHSQPHFYSSCSKYRSTLIIFQQYILLTLEAYTIYHLNKLNCITKMKGLFFCNIKEKIGEIMTKPICKKTWDRKRKAAKTLSYKIVP